MRRLACVKCGEMIRVREGVWFAERFVEQPFLDPRLFVCGECLRPTGELPLEGRVETRDYDPATADIGF